MAKKFGIYLSILSSIYASPTLAEVEYPTLGMAYNLREDSSITYSCKRVPDRTLECEFVQTSIRKKSRAEELTKKLSDAKKQFPDAVKNIAKDKICDWIGPTVQVLDGKKTAEQAAETAFKGAISDKNKFIAGLNGLSDSKKQDLLENMSAYDDFCKTKSEDSFLKLTKIEHQKQTRTCLVSSNAFKQKFKWIGDYEGKGAWVADAPPSGPCGVVLLDRFENDKSLSNNNLPLWRYISKKAITNPKGETIIPGMTCADLDESEYIYDWRNERERKLGCEYIEFSPI